MSYKEYRNYVPVEITISKLRVVNISFSNFIICSKFKKLSVDLKYSLN